MCALGYLAYAGMLSLAKFASTTLAVAEILFFQNLVCLLLAFPLVLQRGVSGFRTSYPLIHLLRDAAHGLEQRGETGRLWVHDDG